MTDNYRQGVGMIVIQDGKILLGQRSRKKNSLSSDFPRALQIPQGGIDPGESPEECLTREVKEELGLDVDSDLKLLCQLPFQTTYDLPESWAKNAWGGKYKGQQHLWFVLQLTKKDFCPDKQLQIATDKEFKTINFYDGQVLLDNCMPYMKTIYMKIIHYLQKDGLVT